MKRITFIIGFILLTPAFLTAETSSQIETLQNKLQNATGIQRAKLLIELSKAYRTISYHDCIKYGKQSIEQSKSSGKISLAGLASKDLGVSCYYTGNYKDALKYFKLGLTYYRQSKNKKGISNCVNDIGLVYEDWSKFDTAAVYYKQSLDIEKELKNNEGIATSLINIGNINYYRKAYNHALENYMDALKIFSDLKDFEGMASAYNSVAVIYEQLNEYNKAIEYLQKARSIYENRNNIRELSKVLDNLGDVYNDHLKQYKKALLLYEQSLDLKRQIDSKSGIALVTCNLGSLYGKIGNLSKGLELLRESEKEYQEIGDNSGLVMVYYNEGAILITARKYRTALKALNKGLHLAHKIGFADYTQKFNEGFFMCYAGLGDYNNFSRYYSIYNAKRDSLINKLELERTAEVESQFKVNELTQKSNQLRERSLHQSRKIRNYDVIAAIFAGVLVILLISAIFYLKIRKKTRALEKGEL